MGKMGQNYWVFILIALCSYLYLCVQPVVSKQYRVDRYTVFNCDNAIKNEYIIYTKSTMKICGGRVKIVSEGYFEVLQDIHEEIKMQGFLSRCYERNPTDCAIKRREFAMPSVCSKEENEEFQITNGMHAFLRQLMKDIMKVLKPPLECPVMKGKYFLNHTIDMSPANILPLEGSRWIIDFVLTIGGPNPKPLFCLNVPVIVRQSTKRG